MGDWKPSRLQAIGTKIRVVAMKRVARKFFVIVIMGGLLSMIVLGALVYVGQRREVMYDDGQIRVEVIKFSGEVDVVLSRRNGKAPSTQWNGEISSIRWRFLDVYIRQTIANVWMSDGVVHVVFDTGPELQCVGGATVIH